MASNYESDELGRYTIYGSGVVRLHNTDGKVDRGHDPKVVKLNNELYKLFLGNDTTEPRREPFENWGKAYNFLESKGLTRLDQEEFSLINHINDNRAKNFYEVWSTSGGNYYDKILYVNFQDKLFYRVS